MTTPNAVFTGHNFRQFKRARVMRKMAAMRSAKARKRMENPVERAPKMERWFPLELGIRDKRNGETAWVDLVSARDANRRIAVILADYL